MATVAPRSNEGPTPKDLHDPSAHHDPHARRESSPHAPQSRRRYRRGVTFALGGAILLTAGLVSAAAGGLYSLSSDESSGPVQPIDFSHALHAGDMKIECLYCHTGADKSQHATVPAVSVCMGCHQYIKEGPSPGSAEEIAKITQFYCGEGEAPNPFQPCTEGSSIPWVRIHNLPEHVQFKHDRHVLPAPTGAGLDCQRCHGPVESMQRVWLVPDTVLRPSSLFLPAQKLEMGWCLDCHLDTGGPDDCAACHY
jgi:hypothetical protein